MTVRSFVAAAGVLALTLLACIAPVSAASSSSTVSITSFAITDQHCTGPVLLPEAYMSIPGVLITPQLGTYPPPELASCTSNPTSSAGPLGSATTTENASADGTAADSAKATGTGLVGERADDQVRMVATVPIPAGASSADVLLPYSTAGLTGGPITCDVYDPTCNYATSGLELFPTGSWNCADGSSVGETVPGGVFLNAPSPAGGGSYSTRVYCPSGSPLAAGTLEIVAQIEVLVYSEDGVTRTAAGQIQVAGAMVTFNP